jgi:hypothetical protein
MAKSDETAEAVIVRDIPKKTTTRRLNGGDMFERLARDPSVDVTKLERLIDMHVAAERRAAEQAFWTDYAAMQPEIPSISKRGEILDKSDQVRSKYAKNEDIQRVLRPILAAHGFALSFRNTQKDGLLTVEGLLVHRLGHVERDAFTAKADDSGSKNAIQAQGSTRSYGQRYTTKALLNITEGGEDDDGATGQEEAPTEQAPPYFEDWLDGLTEAAAISWPRFMRVWNEASAEIREYGARNYRSTLEGLKAKARGLK